jgi:hypothetical protein
LQQTKVLLFFVRQRLTINNTCELVSGGDDGESLYLTSTGKNQFFALRELFLGEIRNGCDTFTKLFRFMAFILFFPLDPQKGIVTDPESGEMDQCLASLMLYPSNVLKISNHQLIYCLAKYQSI